MSDTRVSHRPHIRQEVWSQVVEVAEEEGIRPNRLIEDALEDYLKALKQAKYLDRRRTVQNAKRILRRRKRAMVK